MPCLDLPCRPVAFLRPSLALVLAAAMCQAAHAQHEVGASGYNPPIAEASNEGEQAIARFRVPAGLAVSLFAAEPMVAHPVAFSFDPEGRLYVVETFRHSDGVTDTRGHMNWLDADLASRTVDDRVAMYRKYFSPEEFDHFSQEQDRVRLIEDRDGDGRADFATVFADGFNRPETGLGAGVLPWKDGVFFTCIPDLWWLRDTDGDGRADERKALHQGYGVHVGFLGHDLHGLIMGPDGRLYFTIGDRGLNVNTIDGRHIEWTDSGAVLRCEPDGTKLEIVHVGLRNPQELAFDEEGNLFTVDNNSDGGDKARLVQIVPGGDSGWRIGWQFIEEPNARGPWNAEKMWQPPNDDQPAYILPPLANLADGPSGLAYNPGTALREQDRGRFFLADFRGTSSASGVRSFALKPKGASFELADQSEFLWGLCATDVGFGPDGALYVSDWVEGWNKTGKGRIYRLDEPGTSSEPQRLEVKRLLVEGMARRKAEELGKLLDHDDFRVRLAAQFELAERVSRSPEITGLGYADPIPGNLPVLAELYRRLLPDKAEGGPHWSPRERRHAIWGIGQVARRAPQALSPLPFRVITERDPAIRSQYLRVLADSLRSDPSIFNHPQLRGMMASGETERIGSIKGTVEGGVRNQDPRIRFWAALALGHLKTANGLALLTQLLAENDDHDPYLRHAAVMGLTGYGDRLIELARTLGSDTPAAVRMGVLLALRRLESPEIARLLTDPEPRLVLEAARAINDVPIAEAMPRLAALELGETPSSPLARRVLNANVIVGDGAAANRLASIAGRGDVSTSLRAEALDALAHWGKPSGRDRVTGLWRPIAERSADPARTELASGVKLLFENAPNAVVEAAARAAAALEVHEAEPALAKLATTEEGSTAVRSAALRALATLHPANLLATVKAAALSSSAGVRSTAIDILARESPADAIPVLQAVLESGSTRERQAAFDTLAKVPGEDTSRLLGSWLDHLRDGQVAPELRLELMEAVEARTEPSLKERLAAVVSARPQDDPLAPYRDTLAGGDRRRGSRVFFAKSEVYCLRCHKIRGNGGEVGPDLTGLGAKKDREYLLQAIVTPNHAIAEGFETRVLALDDGQVVAGIVKKDDGKTLVLVTPEAKTLEIARDRVEEERRGDSAMPADLVQKLSKRELRDLIEFLATGR